MPSASAGLVRGHVDPGSANAHPVPVDASAVSAVFPLFWAGNGGAVQLLVERPDGSIVAPSDPDVTYYPPAEVVPGFFAEMYEIGLPAVGQWASHVQAVSVPGEGQDYVVSGFLDSPVTLAFAPQSASLNVGEPVTLTAGLQESGVGITGATVDVTVVKPDDSAEVVILTDNGATPDAQANDGTYTGTLTNTATCGVYGLHVQAHGTASTGTFTRGDSAFVYASVVGDAAGDPCNPDDDGDGCTDSAELGTDETLGGLRDPLNPWDRYDVDGLEGGPDGIIDLLFDILGVIQHYSPTGAPPYDVQFDRGPSSGPNPWNMTAPDGVIDLLNDILGVILQHGHDCR